LTPSESYTVITRLGRQPKALKYQQPIILSCFYHTSLVTNFYHFFVLLVSMAESSSDNPELTRALQKVAQNLLSPAFQVGDTDTQLR
jgi:hypothetical protein